MTSVRCPACLYSFHGETVAVRDRYLAHIPVCPVIAALPAPTVAAQAASFLRHPAQSQRGENAAPGAPIREDGGAGRGVSSPGAAPTPDPMIQWVVNRAIRRVFGWTS